MNSVFLVQHLHNLPGGEEDIKLIGVYSSRAEAEEAVNRLSRQPGFRDTPDTVDYDWSDSDEGFHIDQYQINEDHWCDGFVTMGED